jgi:hypothetical protein
MHITISILRDAHTGLGPGPVSLSSLREAPAFAKEARRELTFDDPVNGNGFQGVLFGFCLESSLGLCAYAIWQLWHLVR